MAIKFYFGAPGERRHDEPRLLAAIQASNVLRIIDARNLSEKWAFFLTPRCGGGKLRSDLGPAFGNSGDRCRSGHNNGRKCDPRTWSDPSRFETRDKLKMAYRSSPISAVYDNSKKGRPTSQLPGIAFSTDRQSYSIRGDMGFEEISTRWAS